MANACNLLLEECDIPKNWENSASHLDNRQGKLIRLVHLLNVCNRIERTLDGIFHIFIKKGGLSLHSNFDYVVW